MLIVEVNMNVPDNCHLLKRKLNSFISEYYDTNIQNIKICLAIKTNKKKLGIENID